MFTDQITSPITSWEIERINGGSNNLAIYHIEIDGKILVDASVTPPGETNVTGSTETAEGTILQVDGTEVDLSASSGRWVADNKAGIPFSFVPSIPIVDTQNEAYGKLQIINDKAQVTGIQATDPGFLNVTAKDYSIQFPSVFATGNAPDVDLPVGCSISAIVKAENDAGSSVKESNVLLPLTPNPEGSAGPITDVTATELTVETSANLDEFIAADALVMVDSTGAVASYTPVTSTIASAAVDSESSVLTVGSPMENFSYKPFTDQLETKSTLTTLGLTQLQASPGWTSQNPKDPTYANSPYIYSNSDGQKMRFNFTGATLNKQYILHTSAGTGAKAYTYKLTGDVTPTNGTEVQSGSAGSGDELKDVCTFTVTQANGYVELEVGPTNGLMIHFMSVGMPGTGENTLTFEASNPDLQFFSPGDNVGTDGGFAPVIYSGNSGTQSITGVGFSPDLVWIKDRTSTSIHYLTDAVRGATKYLDSSGVTDERVDAQSLTSFSDSDGFTLGTIGGVNGSGFDYIAWCWDAGNTTVTNNDGTIEVLFLGQLAF